MPVTPLHLGPGQQLKSLRQGWFSMVIFTWTQLLMDLQPILVVLTGKGELHGFSHSYVGASIIAIIAAYTGKWIYYWIYLFVDKDFTDYQKKIFNVPAKLTLAIGTSSAFIGSFSHVLIDSIMHADMQPFYPLDIENQVLLLVSIEILHRICVYAGLTGALVFFGVRYFKSRPGA